MKRDSENARVWRDDPRAPWMVTIPGGEFVMGAGAGDKFANDTERPAHRVEVATFALSRFPVTVGEFRAFRESHAPGDDDELPAVEVSWDDARDFCKWLPGRQWRLPSEAEWEYACRAGSAGPFTFGSEITPADANFLYSERGERIGRGARTKCGELPANAFGLCDVHGNVCEWVADVWHATYAGAPADGAAWLEGDPALRVIRGGAWDYLPRLLRSAWRDGLPASARRDNLGFRIATSEVPS